MVKNKEYFIRITNVDAQFEIEGFNKNNIFATQGDYGMLQCSKDFCNITCKVDNEKCDIL